MKGKTKTPVILGTIGLLAGIFGAFIWESRTAYRSGLTRIPTGIEADNTRISGVSKPAASTSIIFPPPTMPPLVSPPSFPPRINPPNLTPPQ